MSQNGLPTAGAAPGLAKTGPSLLASLAAMTGSRLPLPDLLRAIAQEHPGAARHALQRLAERVESGVSLDEAFASTQRLFPRGLRRPLQLAASAGDLQVALPALAVQEATRGDVRRRVVSALVYPAMVLCFAFGLAAFVAVAILPQFGGIFEEFELEVPFSTELLFRTAAVLPKAALVVGVGLLVTLLLWAIAPLRGVLQWLATGVPLLGTLWVWVSHHALCEQLSAYLAAGAPLPAALRGSAAALGNRSLAAAVAKAAVRCEQGETLSAAFADSIHIERMLTTTVRWGEHRGNLPGAIGEAAESYRQQIEDYLSFIRSVAGPCLLVTIGGVTGFTLSALMQPLLGLLRGLSG